MAIEIALARESESVTTRLLEIAVGGAVQRCELGADIDYVTRLVRALRGQS